jgi:hypothetical protein
MDGAEAVTRSRQDSSWAEEHACEAAEPGMGRVVEQSRRVRADLEGLASALFETRAEWEAQLRDRLSARPYVGLATAAGVGYVLGAGVSPGLLRAAFGIGRRVVLAMMVRRIAAPVAEMVVGRAL